MHTTQFEQQQLGKYGAREEDFRHFARAVLKPVAPGALMITGDLVDAKTKLMRGLQNETEWQVGPQPHERSLYSVLQAGRYWHAGSMHRS